MRTARAILNLGFKFRSDKFGAAMDYKKALGKWAEDYAELYVINELKMRVIGRNIRNEYGELDIIAIEPKRENFIITGNEHKLENIIRQRQNRDNRS